jgi:integral membrane protein
MNLDFSKTPLGRFRLIAFTEGVSYLVLLFIAMPLKYMADLPLAVKYVGWAHGVLFILYVLALLRVMMEYKWSIAKSFVAFVMSLIPFGTFWYDKTLREEDNRKL